MPPRFTGDRHTSMPPADVVNETTYGAFKQVRLTPAECRRLSLICADASEFFRGYLASVPLSGENLEIVLKAQAEMASIAKKVQW